MDTKTFLQNDLEKLAKEHEVDASNERLLAKSASDNETAKMHEETAKEHLLLARMYRRMQGDASAFVDTYEDYEW